MAVVTSRVSLIGGGVGGRIDVVLDTGQPHAGARLTYLMPKGGIELGTKVRVPVLREIEAGTVVALTGYYRGDPCFEIAGVVYEVEDDYNI